MIGGIAPWFGAKRTLAPEIVAELGEHKAYFELFGGSMAVLLAKPVVSSETVNDLHGDLINLARVVQGERTGCELYRRLRRTLCVRELFDEAAARVRERGRPPAGQPDVDRAYDYFVASWLGMNGVAGTNKYNNGFSRRFTATGGSQGMRFTGAINSVPSWRRRMARVTVLNEDSFGLLERIADHAGTAIYCDPPYLTKGASYVHDFRPEDHVRLAELLGRFKRARVVVSYYDDPRLDELYPGWLKRRFNVQKALANALVSTEVREGLDAAEPVRATEVLLINGRSLADRSRGLFDDACRESDQ
ncbi:MAG TPA: DNA adenine methylase [Pirellulales bacterium]